MSGCRGTQHLSPLLERHHVAAGCEDIKRLPRPVSGTAKAATRPVSYGKAMQQAQVFQRSALPPGFKGSGPAVIEEYGSTTLIWPGDRFEIGALQEIRLTCSGAGKESA